MTLALRWRLTLVYTIVFGLMLAGIGFASYRVFASQLDADASAQLDQLTRGLHGYLRFDAGVPVLAFDPGDTVQVAFVQSAIRYYQVFDARTGRLLFQSDALAPLGAHFTPGEVAALCARPRNVDLQTDYGRLRLSNDLISPSPFEAYLLQVGISLEPLDRALDRFLVLFLVAAPIGLAAAALGGRWMAAVALSPLSRLAAAARTIGIADLGRRLPIRGTGDELDEVATAFNDTLARLAHSVGEMRAFSAALAHELRTPLAALRAEIEMAALHPTRAESADARLRSQLEEIDKLKRLVDRLLTLARAEAGEIPLDRRPVDLTALCRSLVEQLQLVAQARSVALDERIDPGVTVLGDESWLERLLLNLLDNAIKFTPAGGRVELGVGRVGDGAEITVRDTGAGIPPESLPHVFDRFYRVDPARSSPSEGVGLGLTLAKWIVDGHGGSIEVASVPGAGATFTVRLPGGPRPGD